MKKRYIQIGLTALLVGVAVSIPQATSAYRGDPAVKGPNYTEERHKSMEKAFETGDYNAWKALMDGRGRVTQIVTQDTFAEFAEAHELAEQGKFDEARRIRTKLGLGLQNGTGSGRGMGQGSNRR